jgi:hypothetical protein
MKRVPKGAVVLLLAATCVAGRSNAQSEQDATPTPEATQGAPINAAVPQSIPGVLLLMPPAPSPTETQPHTCPFTGQKLELIG